MVPKTVWLPTFFKMSIYMFHRRKEVIHFYSDLDVNVFVFNSVLFQDV